ncbi:MAG: ABC transporter permease [Anaerolineae bacterium]
MDAKITSMDKVATGIESKRRIDVGRLRNMGVLFALLFFVAIFAILSPRFLTIDNFINVSRQISANVIIGCALTFIIITAGIDLSVGSLVALSGVLLAGLMWNYYVPWPIAILITLVVLGLFGMLNGLAVAKQGLNPLIVTLATMTALRGIALSYSGGEPIFIEDPVILALGNGYVGPIPIPVIIAVVVMVVTHIVLTRTQLGRYVYAVGGNEEAARISGINVDRVKLFVYSMSGVLSALAGIIIAGRLYSGNPTAGQGTELDVIAAVVIGGTSLFGGVGSIGGTLLGAFIVGIISNGLTILNVPFYYQLMAKGLVIYVAIVIDKQTRALRQS